ncbi:MAG: hypothetical protein O3A96_12445 [Proteobacteria bacterium]|nr:hypothetical protein [Pseudomonadota bacterium]
MSENSILDTSHDEDLVDEALDRSPGGTALPSVNPCHVLSVGCRSDLS